MQNKSELCKMCFVLIEILGSLSISRYPEVPLAQIVLRLVILYYDPLDEDEACGVHVHHVVVPG